MSIRVTADMGRLLTDLAFLDSRLNEVSRSASRLSKSFIGLSTAIGFGGALLSKNAIIEAFDFVTQAEGLGMTTEAWGRLKLAQMEVGGTTEELARHMQRLDTHLGEAQLTADKTQRVFRGFMGRPNEAAQGFAALNLNAKELDDLAPDERFKKISEAVLKLNTETEQLAALQKIFTNVARGN